MRLRNLEDISEGCPTNFSQNVERETKNMTYHEDFTDALTDPLRIEEEKQKLEDEMIASYSLPVHDMTG